MPPETPRSRPRPRKKTSASAEQLFPIVAIGASAGGLDAFRELLRALPADTGMAFVLIQHLDPTHQSLLAELLGRETPMPVAQASHDEPVQPNRVYVIPPANDLSVFHGRLQLVPRQHENGIHLPIDYFFKALARESEAASIAVVLSGTGSDGVRGLREIKAAGGMAIAQDPSSAEYDGMPRAAVQAGVVDVTGTPTQIAEELERLAHHPLMHQMVVESKTEKPVSSALMPSDLTELYVLMRAATGVDFSHYKVNTIRRRVERRIVLHQMGSLDKYLEMLREDPGEVNALYNDLLINVTQFFRDTEVFDTLRQRVFPEIVRSKSAGQSVRIWVTGCSTGEEVYSLLITLLESFEGIDDRPSITVFGTDISEDAIARARAGIYPSSIRADVSPARLARFFTPLDDGYQVNKAVREMCVFARQDITRDPPFSRMDLVSMRNVLIYMDLELQKRVMEVLHYSLVPSGFLILGTSETVGAQSELFASYDKAHKVYKRRDVTSRLPVDLPRSARLPILPDLRLAEAAAAPAKRFSLQKTADEISLNRYAPPRVIIDANWSIQHFYGDTSAFLEHPSGRASLNVLDMARDGLAMDIKDAVETLRGTGVDYVERETFVQFADGYRRAAIEAVSISSPAGEAYVLIAFRELPALPEDSEQPQPDAQSQRREEQLRRELTAVRKHVQQIVEEKDDANEELRAANEEIQSSNEELQSINEELETAKEELQSTNEELTTINDELARRNIELVELNDDLENFMNSADMPLIMLGSDFSIRRFTAQSVEIAELGTADIGRPISHLRLRVEVGDIDMLTASVVRDMKVRTCEVRRDDGRRYEMRVSPYTTGDKKVTGVVMRFYDIDEIKRALEAAERRAALNAALSEIDWAVASTLEVDDIMQRAVHAASEALGAQTAAIALRESGGWRMTYPYGLPGEATDVLLPDEENSHAVLAASTNHPVVVTDAQSDKRVNSITAKRYNIKSTMVVPLEVRDESLGVLIFNWHSESVDFGETELDFARRLGSTVSLGLENARLYERERRVAETLQEAVLSMSDDVPGVDFSYMYCPASEAANVGGDFYDVFRITDGEVGLLVGDVAGKGLPAARMTSLARDSVRAYAIEGGTPTQILFRANEVLRRASGPDVFVTMFFAILEVDSGKMTYCRAGHAPGVLRRGDGSTELLEGEGTIVGAYPEFDCEERQIVLGPDDTLLLYTDGITEARNRSDEFYAEERLRQALGSMDDEVAAVPAFLLERVLEFSGDTLQDDAVLLAVRLGSGKGTRIECPPRRQLRRRAPGVGGFVWPGASDGAARSAKGAAGTAEPDSAPSSKPAKRRSPKKRS